jgi:hypothetical protein
MRPEIPDEVAVDVDNHVESWYGVDPDALAFSEKVRLVLNDAEAYRNHETEAGLSVMDSQFQQSQR